MYNPFPLLSPSLLLSQVSGENKKRFFVRQTFSRGRTEGVRAAFLFRGYEAAEKDMAAAHMGSLLHDPNAFLYDAENEDHLEKLRSAARQPGGFKIYYVGKKKFSWKLPDSLDQKLKQYISRHHPYWRSKRGGDPIEAGLYEEFGRIFLKLSFLKEEEKIPFEAFENS